MAKLTPIERFLSDIPADPRRAFDARQLQKGLKRVTVTVPVDHIEDLKNFARLLRNSDAETLAMYRTWLHEFLRDFYIGFDEWVEAGEPD